jgi:hypothetical protein
VAEDPLYTKSRATASRLLGKYNQGVISYTSPAITSGPSYNPTIVPGTNYTLKATAQGVSKEYIDGSLIVSSDLEVTAASFEVDPLTSGTMSIDGNTHQIVQIIKIPAAGDVIAWKIICRR